MKSKVTLVEPTAPAQARAGAAISRFDDLQGKVVGFIDNAKPNFGDLVAEIGTLLTERHGVVRVVTHRKRSASLPVAQEALERIAAECDLVIAGSGD